MKQNKKRDREKGKRKRDREEERKKGTKSTKKKKGGRKTIRKCHIEAKSMRYFRLEYNFCNYRELIPYKSNIKLHSRRFSNAKFWLKLHLHVFFDPIFFSNPQTIVIHFFYHGNNRQCMYVISTIGDPIHEQTQVQCTFWQDLNVSAVISDNLSRTSIGK